MDILENNEAGAIVAEIPLEPGVTLELKTNPKNYFTLEGNQLKAEVVFDYDVQPVLEPFTIEITCIPPVGPTVNPLSIYFLSFIFFVRSFM